MRQCPDGGNQLLPSDCRCPRGTGPASYPAASPPPAPPSPPRTSGLAIAALVMGILGLPGLILGILALRGINRSQGRLSGQGLAWSGIGVSLIAGFIIAVLYILIPPFFRPSYSAQMATCLSNVKQLSTRVLQYAEDHDDRLPPAETWSDAILPYVKEPRIFTCPTAKGLRSAYAYNRALSGVSVKSIADPAATVLLYESNLGWNGAGGSDTLASPPRHPRGNAVGFVDGHVRPISVEQQRGLVWQPGAAAGGDP